MIIAILIEFESGHIIIVYYVIYFGFISKRVLIILLKGGSLR